MKTQRKIIEIDDELCDGCGQCVPSCAEGALQIIDGKARMISDNLCDGLGACMGECPTGALKIIEREADEFDEEAVEEHLTKTAQNEIKEPAMACGCPSTQIQSFQAASSCPCSDGDEASAPSPAARGGPSALSNWPIQISLIPPQAPFLKNADLLILADCTAAAYANLHADLITGKTVMMGCPKLDDQDEYIKKFTEIFTIAGIRTITVVSMEVPCCAGLPWIVKKALEASKADIPTGEIVIGVKGNVLSETKGTGAAPIVQIA
jgi:NAD-dependent dihydropyrimidine dehydrogenase PreA subunit